MKKLVLLLLVNITAYGQVQEGQSLVKKILCLICPCFKKKTSRVYAFKPMHRVNGNDELCSMDNTPTTERREESVFDDGELLNVYSSNPITDKHRAELKKMQEKQSRNLLTVPAN
jgi:hypothetical protein